MPDPDSSPNMSSFRNHRVIIASLFLPTTVLLDSQPPEPLPATPNANAHTRQSSLNIPLKSIVDDLKDKSRLNTPALRTPASETTNPFTKLTRFALDPDPAPSHPNPGHAPTATQTQSHAHQDTRIRRKHSRSSSRRAASTPRSPSSTSTPVPPYTFHPSSSANGGLKNAVDSLPRSRLPSKLWVGTLGTPTDAFADPLRKDVERRLREEKESVVVWIPDKEFEGCYDEFCHQVLWPCLHYAVPDAPKTKFFYESASYAQYLSVNRRFARAIVEVYQPGDIVWVNDYHLLLVPALVRVMTKLSTPSGVPKSINGAPTPSNTQPPPLASAPLALFLHVAFPSSEIFRCLSVRAELLRGMLGADLVGFQTGSYARHWRATVGRVLSLEAVPRGVVVPEGWGGFEGLERGVARANANAKEGAKEKEGKRGRKRNGEVVGVGEETVKVKGEEGEEGDVRDGVVERGRFVDVGVFPMGIDVRNLHARRREPEVAEWVQILKQRYAGVKLVVGRDKLDEIQGVRQKLQAFEMFLNTYGVDAPASTNPNTATATGTATTTSTATGTTTETTPTPNPKTQKPPPNPLTQRVTLIQISLPTTSANEAAASSSITDLISRINARHSTLTYTPVVFLRVEEMTFGMYLALLEVADVFLVGSLREGMALRGHEFVECQGGKVNVGGGGGGVGGNGEEKGNGRGRPGVLVLSEFTGSYSYSGFRSCIAVNPWDARGSARAIYEALTMGDDEARSRWEDLHNHVTTQTAQTFVTSFLNRCIRANTEHNASLMDDDEGGGVSGGAMVLSVAHSHSGNSACSGYTADADGNAANATNTENTADGRQQNVASPSILVNRFRHSHKRLLFVDFEGTLWRRDLSKDAVLSLGRSVFSELDDGEGDRDGAEKRVENGVAPLPDEVERAIELLGRLAEDRRNEVWLLSGLKVEGVIERVARRVGRVGIVAENGCFIKTRGTGTGTGPQAEGEWINMVANINLTWKSACLEILNYFTERTPGSFIEERQASMVWRYWTSSSAAAAASASTSSSSSSSSPPSPTSPTASKTTSTSTSNNSNNNNNTHSPERQWAQRQAAEAQNHIFDSLGERYGLRIIPGRNSFLVLPGNVSRSTAVGAVLQPGGVVRGGGGSGGAAGGGGLRHGHGHGHASGGHRHHAHGMSPSVSDAFISPSSVPAPAPAITPSPTGGDVSAGLSRSSSSSTLHSHSHSHSHSHGHSHGHAGSDDVDVDFLLAISSDEKLLRRLNEFEGAETVSTSGKGTDAKWRVRSEESAEVLGCFVRV